MIDGLESEKTSKLSSPLYRAEREEGEYCIARSYRETRHDEDPRHLHPKGYYYAYCAGGMDFTHRAPPEPMTSIIASYVKLRV